LEKLNHRRSEAPFLHDVADCHYDTGRHEFVRLSAIHALPGHEIRSLHTTGPDLSRGTLDVRRGLLRHTLYLEELTHQLAADRTGCRRRRRPVSTSPHLRVSQKTAVDPDHPPVSAGLLSGNLPGG
ncbi:hypothetical protein ABZ698_38365, partial [Streptomyces antibioticus]